MASDLKLKNILQEIDETRIEDLRTIFDDFHPQDIAEDFENLSDIESRLLFDILSFKQGASVIAELEQRDVIKVVNFLSDFQLSKFLNEMALDDAADIIGFLDDTRMLKVLEQIQKPVVLKELLGYEPDTCGGIMNPVFISVRADLKIGAALRYVRIKAKEIHSHIVYIYVTQKFGELVGVISLRNLFLAPDEDTVEKHMTTDVKFIKENEDQEEAAELISKYRFLAIPVVNDNKQLVGIISIDDVVDVIEEETTQDIYQSSGISVETEDTGNIDTENILRSYFGAYKARTPWIIVTLIGQYFAAVLIAGFESTIASIPIAISFMPLLSGLSGNIGNQSTTIIVRGIYLGEVEEKNTIRILFHEFIVSLGIGLTCALMTGFISYLNYHNFLLSLLVASSLIISMALAVSLGTITPIAFERLKIDPATASGPLITTFIDMISFFVYLSLITSFVESLV